MGYLTALAMGLILLGQPAEAETMRGPAGWNVLEYGAVGDGVFDNTAAFQQAMDAASEARGGIVEVPSGRYRFDGVLRIPDNVTLRGTFTYSPAHAGVRDGKSQQMPEFGSVLEPYAGAGSEEGDPFILVGPNATLQGFTIHYPAQDPKADAPTPYPYCIAMRGNNPAVIDLQLLNPFNAIDASRNQRALIRNIHGQPIHIGVYVDVIYDIGRIENVHWNPWWSYQTPVFEWQMKHGIGFIFKKTDWHYVLNTFCFGYNIGYLFAASKAGATNGNFLGIGADDCWTSLVVEESAPMGILITNGEFVSFHGPDPTMIRIKNTHTGTVRFSNCAFWGPANRNVLAEGHGTVGFSDCTFMQWGHKRKGVPSIDAKSGSILVRGCEFLENKEQIHIGPDVDRAVITGNLINGEQRIVNKSKGSIVIRDNAASPTRHGWQDRLKKAPGFRAQMLRQKK